MKTKIYTFIISGCLIMATTFITCAQPGSLDLTFGSGGKVTTDLGSSYDVGHSVAIQSDGKILVAGKFDNGNNIDFSLVRYNSDGTLDNTFSSDGKVITDFGSSDDDGWSVAIQIDGKIVVAGSLESDFAVARFNDDGSLDSSFDSDGKVTTAINGYGFSVAIQIDGKIVVAGTGNGGFALVRYNSDGSLDNTFGSGGIVTTDFGNSDDEGASVSIQSDGKIVVGGFSDNGSDYDFALARYNSDGSLDNSFDSDGKVTTDFGSVDDLGNSVVIQSDGKIVVAGQSCNGYTCNFALVRYNGDGSLDNNFDSDGKVLTEIAGVSVCTSIAIQKDDKIVVAGYNSDFALGDFALARYNNDGSLDNTFDSDGKVTTDFSGNDDIGMSVTIQSDGKLVLAGYTLDDTDYNFAVARYNGGNPVGIAENIAEENTIDISPNPFSNELLIKGIPHTTGQVPEKGEIVLFDVTGKEIMKEKVFDAETKINTEKLLPGFYVLNYTEGNKKQNIAVVKF
ncbi:MAG: T9SS type A sorting domain-containing protein [Chitinophagales bacterium]|nr:T9SS type A sorting domain-containing protein [Chitinophagales bacterium]